MKTAARGKTIDWPGRSGRLYRYRIRAIEEPVEDSPGNYIYAKLNSTGHWAPICLGETERLRERLSRHEKLPRIRRYGGTHVHVHAGSPDAGVRKDEESDLAAKWDPVCRDR